MLLSMTPWPVPSGLGFSFLSANAGGQMPPAAQAAVLSGAKETPDFVLLRPLAGLAQPDNSPAAVMLTPAQIRSAYGFSSITDNGSGQTIAIVDAYNDPTLTTDLQRFDQYYGLPAANLTVVGENGSTTSLAPSSGNSGWSVEISLDVEWAHVAAPGAKILLVEANSAYDSDLLTAVQTAAKYTGVSVVSMSWGGSEFSGVSSYDQYFTTPSGHNGVTFLAAAGDNGAPDVEYPAVSPNVISVGGTTLLVNSSGSYGSESAWGDGQNSAQDGGGGGGVSQYVSEPSYQQGVVPASITTTNRAVPDVSMDADPNSGVPVYDSYDFGSSTPWAQVGGTSLATPLWAGVIALADQARAAQGEGTLSQSQTLPMLYSLQQDFHDVTTGNNGYPAGPGYDLATGLGTPIVNQLVPALVGSTTPTQGVPLVGSLGVSPSSVQAGTSVTLTAGSVHESSGTTAISGVAFYLGQPTGTPLAGTLTQNGTSWTLSGVSTSGMSPGTYTVYAVATDAAGATSTPVSATLTIATPTPTAPANDNFANAVAFKNVNSFTWTGTNVGATKQPGEPNHAGNPGGASVWVDWVAPANGPVTVSTTGSSFTTLLAVYTGNSVSNLRLVANNNHSGTLTSGLVFTARQGVIYRIAVDGYNGGSGPAEGQITLNLVLTPAGHSTGGHVLTAAQWQTA
jgi:subtilase family serine protease